ncbi:MAG: DUF5043 domain-containing protein [Prevotellaceae bacterium]|nr:DUF5043 domain-containing protein [Prevotellaceae bacterium]
MKVKFFILSAVCLTLFSGVARPQAFNQNVSYYTSTKTIAGNGYTYKCDIDSYGDRVTLYNINNQLTYTKWTYKNGEIPPYMIDDVLEETWTRPHSFSIVNNAFSAAEKTWIRATGHLFGVKMIIDSNTGRVSEVIFEFPKETRFQQIPLSTFRTIEVNLKSRIWFTLTAEGRKLRYCRRAWSHDFNTIPDNIPLPPLPPMPSVVPGYQPFGKQGH